MGFNVSTKGSFDHFANLFKRLENMEEVSVEAGFNSDQHPTAGMTFAQLAAIHEYGYEEEHIPQRDFMTQALMDMSASGNPYENIAVDLIYGKGVRADHTFNKIGKLMGEQIRESIIRGNFVELSKKTKALKTQNADKILIETEAMIDSIMSQVVRGDN